MMDALFGSRCSDDPAAAESSTLGSSLTAKTIAMLRYCTPCTIIHSIREAPSAPTTEREMAHVWFVRT